MEKKKQWRLVDKIVTIVLIVVTLLCFIFIVQTAVAGEVSFFGYRLYYVTTGSMEPTIPTGSLIVVKSQEEYQVGDIITFYSNDSAIYGLPNTHRIMEISTEDGISYRTKGDANASVDVLWTAEGDVIGKMVGQVSASQWVAPLITFATTQWGFLLLIICPLLLVTVGFMRDFVRTYQAEVLQVAKKELEDGEVEPEEIPKGDEDL